ncbi:general transcription factor 3C polypeptide 3 [Microplitis mediator]|uniref:general transcription factor 3C polypeptide 3 n=1 Tax=Microplitis mediator TaxID=375433 RepID=UPI002557B085|nr:general transcription factor 3C polypeptide 3 [Microplitis mediator]
MDNEKSNVLITSETNKDIIMETNSEIVPVIIEELEPSQVAALKVDINEFVDANTLEVCELPSGNNDNDTAENNEDDNLVIDEIQLSDEDDNEVMTPEEEARLTRQFLNGELTFSEFTSLMDRGIDDVPPPATEPIPIDGSKKSKKSEETKRPRRRNRGRRRENLPTALKGLMGEANLRFARGEHKTAIQMCMEIIRQVPSAPEAYQTLAMIYETVDPEKALHFSLIAAHLSPKDCEQWTHLANMSLQNGDVKQAITCYIKAIAANPKDVTLYNACAKLQYERNNDDDAYVKAYKKLLKKLDTEDGDVLVHYAKELAKMFVEKENYQEAANSMDQIFNKCPNRVTYDEVNIFADFLIKLKKFQRCLDILTNYTGIGVKYYEDSMPAIASGTTSFPPPFDDKRQIETCTLPDETPIDLKAKFIVAMVELGSTKHVQNYMDALAHEETENVGDLFVDIVEALMHVQEYSKALKFLELLIRCKKYSMPAIWLRYAECHVGCKQLKEAILAYEIVTKLSPELFDAKVQLATLYKSFKMYDWAINILDQNLQDLNQVIYVDALYIRTTLLYKVERYDEFLESVQLLLSRHSIEIKEKSELTYLMATTVKQRCESLQLHRLSFAQPLQDCGPTFHETENKPTDEQEWIVFLKACHAAYKLKKYGVLQRICFTALTCKKFEPQIRNLIWLCLLSCIYNNDYFNGYNIIRELVRDTEKQNLWNILNIVIQRADDTRHNRFIMRLLGRENDYSYLHILHANNCLVSGTYKYALNDYVSLFKEYPDPLLAMLIGVTFLQMACQKFTPKKHQLVTQSLAFLKKYADLRGPEMKQESNYNIGRALHQLGFLSTALNFYKQALNPPSAPYHQLVTDNEQLLNIKREAAFNIHLIYMQTGNKDLARMYLHEYIVV